MEHYWGDNYHIERLFKYIRIDNDGVFKSNKLEKIGFIFLAITCFIAIAVDNDIIESYIYFSGTVLTTIFLIILFLMKIVKNRQIDWSLVCTILCMGFIICIAVHFMHSAYRSMEILSQIN